jgi:hypothetical protein
MRGTTTTTATATGTTPNRDSVPVIVRSGMTTVYGPMDKSI